MADAKQDVNNGPSNSSRVVLAKPRLGGFGSSSFGASSTSKTNNPFGSVLRPPQLKPGANPFLKVTENLEEKTDERKPELPPNEERLKEGQEAPKFMPLGSSNVTPRTTNQVPTPSQPASSSSGFVFGQKLSERVVMKENVNNGDVKNVDHSSSNGTSQLLFTNAVATVKDNSQEASSEGTSEGGSEGLAAAAAEYERSHARPPPPSNTVTTTGEEGEINVLQISCRLFAWETGSWRERGRGVLRLNDASDGTGARVVARVAGSLRVVLNTKLWPEMIVERAGTKSLRITAADIQQQIKLFLIMGAPADITQLHRALSTRIATSKKASSVHATSHTDIERLDNLHDDKPEPEDYEDEPLNEKIEDSKKNDEGIEDSDRLETQKDVPLENVESKEDKTPLKRKEPIEDEASPKRQCPKILVE